MANAHHYHHIPQLEIKLSVLVIPPLQIKVSRGVRSTCTGTPKARTDDIFTLWTHSNVQCQIYSHSNLNLETLMSSEALIIGEQKMIIQQLRAAEPFRVN